MFLSLFALWCWRLKVAYSKLTFGQRRAFRNKKEEPEGLWGSTHPELFVFIDRAQNVRPTKLRQRTFKKFAFTSKEPFLCNMFALDFISWLISWQRGLYAENNFFKKCPFLAIFWASNFGTKFVLLEAYTVEAPLKTVAKFPIFLAPEMVPTKISDLVQHCAMTVITFLQLLLAWGFRISEKENPANLANKSAGNPISRNLGKPSANWTTYTKPAKPCGKPWKPAETLKTLHKMFGTLRKPLGNPAETQATCRKPAETFRKPCGNPRKTLHYHSPFGN